MPLARSIVPAARALLFDLDGTLVDTALANASAYAAALAEAGIAIRPAELSLRIAGRHWREFLPDVISEAGVYAAPAAIAARKAAIYPTFAAQARLNVGLVALLCAVRGQLQTALVTTASRVNVDAVLGARGLLGLFDVIVVGDDVTNHKPDPEAYELVMRRLNRRPEECLAFEDSPTGLASAARAGVPVVAVAFPPIFEAQRQRCDATGGARKSARRPACDAPDWRRERSAPSSARGREWIGHARRSCGFPGSSGFATKVSRPGGRSKAREGGRQRGVGPVSRSRRRASRRRSIPVASPTSRKCSLDMNIALLVRGYNMLEKDRFGFPLDSRVCIERFVQFLLQPLQAEHQVKVYFVTYDSPALPAWVEAVKPELATLLDAGASSQISTFTRGLQDVYARFRDLDCIVAVQFDLLYLKPFNDWGIKLSRDQIVFPWREYKYYWRDHKRVGDAIHIVGASALQAFFTALQCVGLLRPNMHLLYYIATLLYPNLSFIDDGFWDSNTLFNNPESFNPVYRICNRPRLDFAPPDLDRIIPEIRGL